MKSFIHFTLGVIIFLFSTTTIWAVQDNLPKGLLSEQMCITTYTSEPCGTDGTPVGTTWTGNSNQLARYACTVCWPNSFITFISGIYKYIFFICLIVGVLTIVILGIGMSISGVSTEELKTKSKERIGLIVSGLIAMSLIPWILKTVAPFFFK